MYGLLRILNYAHAYANIRARPREHTRAHMCTHRQRRPKKVKRERDGFENPKDIFKLITIDWSKKLTGRPRPINNNNNIEWLIFG